MGFDTLLLLATLALLLVGLCRFCQAPRCPRCGSAFSLDRGEGVLPIRQCSACNEVYEVRRP